MNKKMKINKIEIENLFQIFKTKIISLIYFIINKKTFKYLLN